MVNNEEYEEARAFEKQWGKGPDVSLWDKAGIAWFQHRIRQAHKREPALRERQAREFAENPTTAPTLPRNGR